MSQTLAGCAAVQRDRGREEIKKSVSFLLELLYISPHYGATLSVSPSPIGAVFTALLVSYWMKNMNNKPSKDNAWFLGHDQSLKNTNFKSCGQDYFLHTSLHTKTLHFQMVNDGKWLHLYSILLTPSWHYKRFTEASHWGG